MADHVLIYNPNDGHSYATAPTPKLNNTIDTTKNNNEVATTEWVNAISDLTREEILSAADKAINAFDTVPSEVTVSGILSAISRLDSNYENNVVKVSTPHVVETWIARDKFTWYRKWSDGYIEQGGVVVTPNASWTDVTVTLPLSYTSTWYSISVSGISHTNSSNNVGSLQEKTTTSFKHVFYNSLGESAYPCWYTCGY